MIVAIAVLPVVVLVVLVVVLFVVVLVVVVLVIAIVGVVVASLLVLPRTHGRALAYTSSGRLHEQHSFFTSPHIPGSAARA